MDTRVVDELVNVSIALAAAREIIAHHIREVNPGKKVDPKFGDVSYYLMLGFANAEQYVPVSVIWFNRKKCDATNGVEYEVVKVVTSIEAWTENGGNSDGQPFRRRGVASMLLFLLREMALVEDRQKGGLYLACPNTTRLSTWFTSLGFEEDQNNDHYIDNDDLYLSTQTPIILPPNRR
jgi:hypothetical protein